MAKDKIILGGGIAGLIFAFYNSEYKIVTKDIGGQFNSSFPLGPRFLEVDEYSKKLLEDLNINAKIKEAKVGYYYENKVNNLINKRLYEQYLEKSRGEKVTDKTSMNKNKSNFLYYDINITLIINILQEKLKKRITIGTPKKIDMENKKIHLLSGEIIFYDNIVSTIPKNIFLQLIKQEHALNSKTITYCLLNKHQYLLEDYDFVYFPEKQHIFHRATKFGDNALIVDLFGEYQKEDLKNMFQEDYENSVILKGAQIIPEDNKKSFFDIKFLGRYGAWNRDYKINRVIKESIQ